MKTAQKYNTRLRGQILSFFSEDGDRCVSAGELHSALTEAGVSINLTTVYRKLDALTREGVLLRFSDEGSGVAMYKYSGKDGGCAGHLHARCTECGEVSHLDCEFMAQIAEHAKDAHGFTISSEQSMLYGICGKCMQRRGRT